MVKVKPITQSDFFRRAISLSNLRKQVPNFNKGKGKGAAVPGMESVDMKAAKAASEELQKAHEAIQATCTKLKVRPNKRRWIRMKYKSSL